MEISKIKELINSAFSARKNSYSKYSDFAVGAAVLTDDGKIFSGANIENVSYPVGICAERAAFSAAISEGYRNFSAVAVAGGRKNNENLCENYCMPCGMCRQFMAEFCWDDYKEYKLSQLLPEGFNF